MLDHVTLGVADFDRSKMFHDRVLAAIGLERRHDDGHRFAGNGTPDRPFFWIGLKQSVAAGTRVAFAVADRASVERFHATALACGGRDNGGPGLRPQYHANYYGAFVLDPDGHNIEAVCRSPSN